MIYKKCVMTIDKNKATLDEDIYLYRLDKNIELYFTIVNNKYRFNKGDMNNIILITNASFFQVRLYKNAEIKYTFAIQPTDGGQAILTITDDLIDDPIETGDYDFQISLLDEEKTSMISMPIVSKQLHVCEPLVSDDATMGKAVLGLSKLATGEIKNAFDSDGNYIREIHKDGDILSASIINKFEEALDTNTKAIKNGTGTSYDDTEIKTDINTIKTDLGTEELTTTAKNVKGAINELDTQYKDIANLSLTKHTDGKVYIKKQDGTLIGDGIEVGGSDADLSKITMSMSGQTLKLMNDGTQIATVEIPTAVVTDAQLTSIIQSKIDDGTITNMTIPDDSITTKKLNIAPKVVNIITNPDFSNGTTGYTLSSSTTVISDDGVEVTPTAQNGGISKRDILFTNEHKIYVSTLVKTNSSNVELQVYNPRFSRDIYYSNSGEFERLSDIFTSNSYKCNINVKNTSDDSLPFIVKSFTCIDLTEAFGSGNEPDKEYMDEFLNGFNNGVIVNDGLQILGDTHIRNKRIDNILPKITKIDDTDENIVYYGTWTKETNSNYDNNSSHYSSDKNSYMEYTFMGTGINIYDATGYNKGMVEIFIDGVSKGTIDRYTSGMVYKTLMYSILNLSFDIHTIKIVVTRTKNDRSSDYTFTFDYLEIVDYFPLDNTDKEKETSIYKAKISNTLSKVVKDSKLTLLKHTNAITINSAKPTTGNTTNPLQVNTYQGTKKALLKFDISSLESKKIKKAYLRLVCGNYNDNAILDTSFNINAVLLPWDNTASWNNYSNSNAWNTAGASGNGTDINLDTINVENIYNVGEWTNGFFADITDIVSNWIKGVYDNNGILISGDGANFISESFNGESPCLIVEYTDNLDDISMFTPAKKIQNAMIFLAQGHGTGLFSWQSAGALNAMANAYTLFGDEYKENLITFFNHYIDESGEFINGATVDNMYKTSFAPALISLYKVTNETRYLTALQSMRAMVDSQPKDSNGIYTISSAITELAYCGLAFLADYGDVFNDQTSTDIAIEQCILLYDKLRQYDGIPYHQVNLVVSKGWSRGMGWLFTGMAKVLSSNKVKQHSKYNELVTKFIEFANTLRRYQRPSGAWCNIIHDSSTFEESSGTILFGTAISIGLKEGLLDGSFNETLSKIIDVICKEHTKTGTDMQNVFMYRNDSYRSPEKNVSNIGWGLFAEMITTIAKNNI